MKYTRINRKACMNRMAKANFDFDYKQELLQYKYFTGERMSISEWNNLDESNLCSSYHEWKKSVENNNQGKNKKELIEFEYYLDNRINMVTPQKELHVIMCSVILTGIITFVLDHLEILDKLMMKESMVVSIIIVLLFLILLVTSIGFVMFNVMMPIWDTSIEKSFLKEYRKVIKKMIIKK